MRDPDVELEESLRLSRTFDLTLKMYFFTLVLAFLVAVGMTIHSYYKQPPPKAEAEEHDVP